GGIDVSPTGPPAFTDFDVFTLLVATGSQSSTPLMPLQQAEAIAASQLQSAAPENGAPSSQSIELATGLFRRVNELNGIAFLAASDTSTEQIARSTLVTAYADRPRLVLLTSQLAASSDSTSVGHLSSIDLRRDSVRSVVYPGQNTDASFDFQFLR